MTTTTTEPVIENQAPKSGARRLGVIGLALVLISAMDSIRNLPTTAMFGWSASSSTPSQSQAVSIFFAKLGISSLMRPFGVLVIIGVLCGLASWSMGPAEGMRRVAADGHLNPWWGRTNRRGAPTMVLLLQATLGSLLTLAMVLVNNINTYYWMLTALVAQTFLVMYFLMYISVGAAAHHQARRPAALRDPGWQAGTDAGHRGGGGRRAVQLLPGVHPRDSPVDVEPSRTSR